MPVMLAGAASAALRWYPAWMNRRGTPPGLPAADDRESRPAGRRPGRPLL